MDLRVDGQRKYPKSKLLLSSADRGWPTLGAEIRCHPISQTASAIQRNTEIVIAIEGNDTGSVLRTSAGYQQLTGAEAGTIWLVPEGMGNEELSITAPIPKALHLYLPTQPFNILAKQFGFTRSPVESLQYVGGFKDELIRQIGLTVLSELKVETVTGRMLVETASLMLASRLIHDYSDGSFLKQTSARQQRLDKVRLRRVLEYIDHHLEEDIAVADLASVANLSAFHFTRMFTAAVGAAPFRYVSRKRLELAMSLLANSALSLSEIAHRSRFASQASFNRAFRRATGMTPGEYRRLIG